MKTPKALDPVVCAGLLLAAALVPIVAAQGPGRPGPRMPWGEFGPGPGGPFISSQGPAFQAMFSRTREENVVNNGATSTITTAMSGTIARASDGSTYVGSSRPRGSSGGNEVIETALIRNATTMKSYVINLTKHTYQEFSLRPQAGNRRPQKPQGSNAPVPTPYNFMDSVSGFTCAAEETKTSRTIQPPPGPGGTANPAITVIDDRIFCPALSAVVRESHSDPRIGSTTYVLSGITTGAPSVSFTPPSNYTLVKSRRFGHRPGKPQTAPAQ